MLNIRSQEKDGTYYLKVKGILDISTNKIFEEHIQKITDTKNVVIDFYELSLIDSTGIGKLAQTISKMHKENIGIKIINIPEDIYEILSLLGFVKIYGEEIFEKK